MRPSDFVFGAMLDAGLTKRDYRLHVLKIVAGYPKTTGHQGDESFEELERMYDKMHRIKVHRTIRDAQYPGFDEATKGWTGP